MPQVPKSQTFTRPAINHLDSSPSVMIRPAPLARSLISRRVLLQDVLLSSAYRQALQTTRARVTVISYSALNVSQISPNKSPSRRSPLDVRKLGHLTKLAVRSRRKKPSQEHSITTLGESRAAASGLKYAILK